MRADIRNKERQLRRLKDKHQERLENSLEDDFLSQFTVKSVMSLREAMIQHFQDTGYSPPQDIQDKLMTIKQKAELLESLDIKSSEFKSNIESGKAANFEKDDDWL